MNLFPCTRTYTRVCSGWTSTSVMAIRCASGDLWLDSDFDEWSVKMLSLSVSSSPFTQRRDSLCACLGHTWGGGVMTACVLVAVGVGCRINAPLNVWYFGNPQSHVSGTCGHYTSHWSGVRLWLKRQRARGLNTVTPAVLMGKSMIFPLLHFSCFEIITSI